MDWMTRQVYESFAEAWPDARCGLYGPGQRLLLGRDCPQRAGEEGALGIPLAVGGTILVFGEPGEETAGRMRRFVRSAERLLQKKQDLLLDVTARQDKMSLLLNRLFALNTAEDVAYTAMSAVNMGYDMTIPRVICLFELQEGMRDGEPPEGILRQALDAIRSQADVTEQDLIGAVNSHQIALCKTVPQGDPEICRQLAGRVSRALFHLLRLPVQTGIGDVCSAIQEYGGSFFEISQLLRAQRGYSRPEACCLTSEHQDILDVLHMPPGQLNHFFGEKAAKLEEAPQLLETVEALLRCDGSIQKTADMLFVHHNTVLFRIRHIRKMLSLDPLHRDSGLATLSLLYHYCRLKPMIQPGYAKARAEGE